MRRLLHTSAILVILLAAASAQSGGAGSIAGRVVDASTGAPLHRAKVEIHPEGHNDILGEAPSDGEGRFLLRGLPAGQYRIRVSRIGYGTMAYGASRPDGLGRVLVLRAGEQITDLTFRLPRLGVITGTVMGSDGGPLPGARMEALRPQYGRGKPGWAAWHFAQTDDQGRYRLFGLEPGRYLVSASKQPEYGGMVVSGDSAEQNNRLAYATTYAPGTLRTDQAREIELQPGETLDGVEIAMQSIRPNKLGVQAHLPVQLPPQETSEVSPDGAARPNQPIINLHLTEAACGCRASPSWGGVLVPGGRFEYLDKPPGQYVLSGEVTIDGRMCAARQEVDLNGGDLEVTLEFAPAIALRGRLRLEGASAGPAVGHRVHLVSGDNQNERGASAEVRADGSFVLPNVPPGVWDIDVDPLPKGGYLKSMMLGGEDVLCHDMLITAATAARLEIVVSAAGAELSGQVEGAATGVVLLAPQGEDAAVWSFYATTGVDEKGNFHFRGRTPGVYKVFAFDGLGLGEWMDPNFLKPIADQGTVVELHEGPNADVKVRLVRNTGAGE